MDLNLNFINFILNQLKQLHFIFIFVILQQYTINMDFDADVKMLGRYWAIVRATELDSRTTSQRQNQDCLLINTYDTDKFIRIISCNSI